MYMTKPVRRCFKQTSPGNYIVGKMCNPIGSEEKYATEIPKKKKPKKKPLPVFLNLRGGDEPPKKKPAPPKKEKAKKPAPPKKEKAKKPAPPKKEKAKKPAPPKKEKAKKAAPAKNAIDDKPTPVPFVADRVEKKKGDIVTDIFTFFHSRDGATKRGTAELETDSYGNTRGNMRARPPGDYVFVPNLLSVRQVSRNGEIVDIYNPITLLQQFHGLKGKIPILGYAKDLYYANDMEKENGGSKEGKAKRMAEYRLKWIKAFNEFVQKTPLYKDAGGGNLYYNEQKKLEKNYKPTYHASSSLFLC